MKKKVCIIGGGVAGLSLAFFLPQEKFDVSVYEKEEYLGGLLASFCLSSGIKIERFYHHVFPSDKEFISLVKDLNLSSRLIFLDSPTSIFASGKYYGFSGPIDYLRFPALSIAEKIKMGVGGLAFAKKNFVQLKDKTSKAAIREFLGEAAWAKIWEPLFAKKFGTYADVIPASWFLWRMQKKLGSNKLGYMKNGFAELISTLEKKITEKGHKIFVSKEVSSIKEDRNGFTVQDEVFDYVISTLPKETFGKSNLGKKQEDNYIAAINAVLEMKNRQTKWYWNNILDKDIPFVGIIEHTNFVDSKAYSGKSILYLSQYLRKDDPMFSKKDEEILRDYGKYFFRVGINKHEIISASVFKSCWAQPIVNRRKGFKTSTPNLFSLSMENIYPEDRGINQAIRNAKILSERLVIENN